MAKKKKRMHSDDMTLNEIAKLEEKALAGDKKAKRELEKSGWWKDGKPNETIADLFKTPDGKSLVDFAEAKKRPVA